MRKYHQLLLFITAVASLSLLLVYKHEYNRLHYVLEVFNFFGQGCNLTQAGALEASGRYDWGPEPLWQASGDVWFYSGFWTEKNEAKVLALRVHRNEVPRSCHLWVEERRKPLEGKVRYGNVASGGETYFYYCSIAEKLKAAPYAVSFNTLRKNPTISGKIMLRNAVAPSLVANVTICLTPMDEFSKSAFLEFIAFHKLIGVEDFIVYGGNVPHRLVKILTNLSLRLGVRVTFFPWNYPGDGQKSAHQLVESDCLLRTSQHANSTIMLDVDEFVVPRQGYHFPKFTDSSDSQRLALPVQRFCVTRNRRNRPVVLQNTLIMQSDDNPVRYVYKGHDGESLSTRVIASDVASIHKYVDCGNNTQGESPYRDGEILKYDTDLSRSTLMQLLIHGHI